VKATNGNARRPNGHAPGVSSPPFCDRHTVVFHRPTASSQPSISWWLGCHSRAGFAAKAAEQKERMVNSRMAATLPTR
jgi:hypothetical protein